MAVVLRDYQQAAVDAVRRELTASCSALAVLPTGSGKSLVAAAVVEPVAAWTGRALILAPSQELVEQDAAAVRAFAPHLKVTLACAGLGPVDMSGSVVIGTPQTVVNRELLGDIEIVAIDEVHRVPVDPGSQLRTIIAAARDINPGVKLVGLTATPFRLDAGRLDEGDDRLFDRVAYDVDLIGLVKRGYLAPLVGPVSGTKLTKLDISGLGIRGGDFSDEEMQARFNRADVNEAIAADIVRLGEDRKSWLVFATGVAHAEALAEELRALGVSAEAVVGSTPKDERARLIAAFKAGELRCLVNCAVLTTGFDAPGVDLIAFARPTVSTSLHVQMAGRGTRIAPAKKNCLILDFAGNFARLGPINAPRTREKGERAATTAGLVLAKVCPECSALIAARSIRCEVCDADLAAKVVRDAGLSSAADRTVVPMAMDAGVAGSGALPAGVVAVHEIEYQVHRKLGSAPSLRVGYRLASGRCVSEWIVAWHGGYAGQKGAAEWRRRLKPNAPFALPADAVEAAQVAPDRLVAPAFIKVDVVNGFDRVTPWSPPALAQAASW